jgi:hypothetical protein
MKEGNRKFDRSQKGRSRQLGSGRKGRAGRGKAMNGKELFCFCGLCICGYKEMFEVNREVMSALKQCFIMPSALLIYRSSTSISTYLCSHNFANCITFPTRVEIVRNPGIFIPNVQSWSKGIFMSFLGQSDYFFKTFLIPSWTSVSFVCCCQKHVLSALSTHCFHEILCK